MAEVKVTIAATNISELVQRAAERTPSKAALVEPATGSSRGPSVVTWTELDQQVSSIAGGLGRAGLVGGQRVAICLANSAASVATYLGVLRAGMVAVPLNPGSTTGEVARMLADSGSRLCFT